MSGGLTETVRDVTSTVERDGVLAGLVSLDGLRLDYAFAILMLWQVSGAILDIRKHAQGFSFAEEGLLTPEHSVMWTGFVVLLALLFAVTIARRVSLEKSWIGAIPPGYELGFLGMLLWALALPGDMYWHVLFGTEESFTALLSPTHLTLALGGGLFLSSPIRSTWRRRFEGSWRTLFPSIVAAAFTLSLVTMFTMYAHPTFLLAGTEAGMGEASTGVGAFLVQTTVLAGVCCLLVRRFDVPPGGFTLLVATNGAIMVVMGATNDAAAISLFVAYVVAGLVADGLAARFGRIGAETARLRLFCVAVPVAWTATHMAVVAYALGGIAWSTHTWTGTIFLSGAAGLLVSVLVAPSPHDPDLKGAESPAD